MSTTGTLLTSGAFPLAAPAAAALCVRDPGELWHRAAVDTVLRNGPHGLEALVAQQIALVAPPGGDAPAEQQWKLQVLLARARQLDDAGPPGLSLAMDATLFASAAGSDCWELRWNLLRHRRAFLFILKEVMREASAREVTLGIFRS